MRMLILLAVAWGALSGMSARAQPYSIATGVSSDAGKVRLIILRSEAGGVEAHADDGQGVGDKRDGQDGGVHVGLCEHERIFQPWCRVIQVGERTHPRTLPRVRESA